MGKSKKRERTWRECILQWLAVLGVLLTLPTAIPPVPWRYVKASSAFGPRFSTHRYYSLFGATDSASQMSSWFKLRKQICAKYEQFNRPNPIGMIVSVVADKTMGVGGAVGGCENWGACKSHVSARCTGYTKMSISGIASIFMILLGGICGVCTPLLLAQEFNVKKKKKKQEEAKQSTMICIIASFTLNFMTVASWWILSHGTYKSFQNTGYYPYPPVYVGFYLHAVGTFILFVAMYCGITRVFPLFSGGAQDDEDGEGVEFDDSGRERQISNGLSMGPPEFGHYAEDAAAPMGARPYASSYEQGPPPTLDEAMGRNKNVNPDMQPAW